MSTLTDLVNYGQSYWLDNLTRKIITNGELHKRIVEQGLRGITSNPAIFNKAIADSDDYDEQMTSLVKNGESPLQIYDALTIKDVQDACDILKPVYEQSEGADGFVSLEVSPYLARDTQGTMQEARRLFNAVARPNCMIKIPGTREGIPVIEQSLYEGININITLLFSIERYADVAEAYIRAIERRVAEGKPVSNIVSVTSIFISRIDTLCDELIGQHVIAPQENKNLNRPEALFGKAGVATARLSYQRFKQIFSSGTWKALEAKGAHVQRPLWASTGNKDPLHDDLRYVTPLIGEDTVNTLPEATIAALADHGDLQKNAIEAGTEQAVQVFADIKVLGIDMDFVTQQLENEGIRKFTDAYDQSISNLADKRINILGDKASSQRISYGKLEATINAACAVMDTRKAGRLLFAKDPYLWNADTQQTKEIKQRLDWLTLPDHFKENANELLTFALQVKEESYEYAVLLGMGGSSLCSEVARETFGTVNGYLQLLVLDNTDPAAISEVEKNISIDKTLFIVASKSGNTEETLSFFRYFYHQLEQKNNNKPGNNFVAITDAGTPLADIAEQYQFRKIFLNVPGLGGRYSVLSDFGLLPMALSGIDINAFLSSARQMENSCDSIPAAANPGIGLGVVLGICQRHGRDKVTFVLSSALRSFGYWLEQLLAESTGKDGKGLIPVNGELPGEPGVYGTDRLFIHMYLPVDDNAADDKKIQALEAAGHPVVRIKVADKIALGGEYYRWEIAVAIAGIVMGINPFDQPNVEESKANTQQLLEVWSREGAFEKAEPTWNLEPVSIYSGKNTKYLAANHYKSATAFINGFTELAKPGDYIALLPYFLMTEHRDNILQAWRQQMRDELKMATTLLNGPRYLHSTGQLHKGGPDTGLYILLTGDEQKDLAIPGEKFGFATLHRAQALGDFRSLDNKGRRVIRINLGKDIDAGLEMLYPSMKKANKQYV